MSEAGQLVRALKASGIVESEIAEAVGVSQPSVNDWVNKDASPNSKNMDKLRAFARSKGIKLDGGIRFIDPSSLSPEIKEIDTRLGAGGGGIPSIHNEEAYREASWNMPADFLRAELKISPRKALIAEIVGDSGYDPSNPHAPGSLHPGDRVIVDTDDRQPSPPGPFAVYDGMGLVVKHVDVVRDTDPLMLRLSSRNPSYLPYDVSESEGFFVIGRVKGRISRL